MPVTNPSQIRFDSPDHAAPEVTGYEFDFKNTSTQQVSTMSVPKAETTVVDGHVVATVNLQPIKFGEYVTIARTLAGAVKSVDSPASDPWQRAAGSPSKPVMA